MSPLRIRLWEDEELIKWEDPMLFKMGKKGRTGAGQLGCEGPVVAAPPVGGHSPKPRGAQAWRGMAESGSSLPPGWPGSPLVQCRPLSEMQPASFTWP